MGKLRANFESSDHPRSRGVYPHTPTTNRENHGSSPLARGLRAGAREHADVRRIIPARAGFTLAVFVTSWAREDHPRSRGVYFARRLAEIDVTGSSPLARGLRSPLSIFDTDSRIIPARAGFTRDYTIRTAQKKDHPRSRGVYSFSPPRSSWRIGSSPLARGLRRRSRTQINRSGIIPARAGFTPSGGVRQLRHQDHPRSRGVYAHPRVFAYRGGGSSPLARGLQVPLTLVSYSHGIIPARAGFTKTYAPLHKTHPDHPRSRGVYDRGDVPRMPGDGSSPLARGLPPIRSHPPGAPRIIPARAGFTARMVRSASYEEDHPRSCGVYLQQVLHGFCNQGSSPLARGLHARLQ